MPAIKRIPRATSFDDISHFTLDAKTPPVLTVEPGESFVAETEAAFGAPCGTGRRGSTPAI